MDTPSDIAPLKMLKPLTLLDIELPEILHVLLPAEGTKERVKVWLGEDSLLLCRKNYELACRADSSDAEKIDLCIQIEPYEVLGLTIIGEQPVTVSRIFSHSPADVYGVKPDDVIHSINDKNVLQLNRDSVGRMLKRLSGAVTITILRASLPHSTNTTRDSLLSDWEPYLSIPLLHASISLYVAGTAVRLKNGFSICSSDGYKDVTLFCDDQESSELLLWVSALKQSLLKANTDYLDELNRLIPKEDPILLTGLLFEQLHPSPHLLYWEKRFVVCTQSEIRVYSSPPSDGHSWQQFVAKLNLMTTSFNLLKERNDLRSNSFILRSEFGTSHILSAETWDDLTIWINALSISTPKSVMTNPVKSYSAIWERRRILFEINYPLSSIRFLEYKGNAVIYNWPLSIIESTKESLNSTLIIRFLKSSVPVNHPTCIQIQLENITSVIHTLRSFLLTKMTENEPKYVNTFTLNAF